MIDTTDMTPAQLRALADELERKAEVPPAKLPSRDWSRLEKLLDEYLAYIQDDDFCEDNDYKQYVYQAAIEAVFGKAFWQWYNRMVT